jgi:hypothetical protein
MNTSVDTFAQTEATAAPGLPLSVSAEAGLTGTTPKDLGLPWTPNLAKAFHCSRAAQREERNGFTYTAAMKWRNAAELFAPDTRAVEYCWHEWERIMHLPRRLAGPVPLDPIPSYRCCQPGKVQQVQSQEWTELSWGIMRESAGGHHVGAMLSIM